MTGHTHTLADWAAMGCIAVSGYSSCSVFYFLLVESESARDFDPRPVLRRATAVGRQAAVFAGHDLVWTAMSVRHELVPVAVFIRHAAHSTREVARDIAALLILLTTRPTGAMA